MLLAFGIWKTTNACCEFHLWVGIVLEECEWLPSSSPGQVSLESRSQTSELWGWTMSVMGSLEGDSYGSATDISIGRWKERTTTGHDYIQCSHTVWNCVIGVTPNFLECIRLQLSLFNLSSLSLSYQKEVDVFWLDLCLITSIVLQVQVEPEDKDLNVRQEVAYLSQQFFML